ncbi:MAG: hypothetical protein JSS65_01080 [Armatimonadetes bacterium]|nr:hypothetical protein [Armatimonadota bacterium]
MKNQNDIIAIIVAAVLAIGASCYFIFAHRKPETPASPTPVPTAATKVPEGSLALANSLPGGGGGGGGGARGGFAGGPTAGRGPSGFSAGGGPAAGRGPSGFSAGGAAPASGGGSKWSNLK